MIKKNYLITGGAGFIGTNLIIELNNEEHNLVSLDNYSTGKKENEQSGCKYFNVDISNTDDYSNFIKNPDLIFHLAALPRIQPSFTNPSDTFDSNVKATMNILEWARKNNTPVVYAGSSSTHGGVYKNPYTFTKWQGEELCKLYLKIYGLPVSICRFYNVYGLNQLIEGEYCTVIGIFERQKQNNEELTITGDGNQRRDFTHVNDIVDGLIKCGEGLMSENNKDIVGEIFELGRGINYSINDVADMFGCRKKYIPKKEGEVMNTLCTDKKAKKILNWIPKINLEDYIK